MSKDVQDALFAFIDYRIGLVNMIISKNSGILKPSRAKKLNDCEIILNRLLKYRKRVSKGFYLTPKQYNYIYFQEGILKRLG
jgi:hypothetical protein